MKTIKLNDIDVQIKHSKDGAVIWCSHWHLISKLGVREVFYGPACYGHTTYFVN